MAYSNTCYGKIYPDMAKIRQRNWLLLITVVLVLSSIGILFTTLRGGSETESETYESVEYSVNDTVLDYKDFVNENMSFTYSFRNYLDKDQPNLVDAKLVDIQHNDSSLRIVIEREVLCGDFNETPAQAGMYKLGQEGIVLTAITNRDESIYNRVCLIDNIFEIEGINLVDRSEFSVSYQDDQGNMTNFRTCLANGNIYSNGAVFKDLESNSICTCLGPEVECEGP